MSDDKRKYEKVDTILGRLIVSMLATAFTTAGVRAVAGDASPLYLFLLALVFLLFGLACGSATIREFYVVRIMMGYKNRKSYETTEMIGSYLLMVATGVGCIICLLVFFSRLLVQ